MALWFAFSEADVQDWGCWTIFLLPLALPLSLLLVWCLFRLVRLWNMRLSGKCPRCRIRPTVAAVYNVCASCGCEYDKWGNLVKEAPKPVLDTLDLARFTPQRDAPGRREDSQEFKTGGAVQN
jgi:hypothetical protein